MSLEHITLSRVAAPARSAAARPAGRRGPVVRPTHPTQVEIATKRQVNPLKLTVWLVDNELDEVGPVLEEHGIQLLADLRTLSHGDFEAMGLDAAQVDRMWRALHAQQAPLAGTAAEQPVHAAAQHKQGRSRGLRDRLPFKALSQRGQRKALRTSEAVPAPAPAPASTGSFRSTPKRPQEARLVAHAAVPQQPFTPQEPVTPTSICSPVGTPVATYDRDRCPDTGKLRSLCHCAKCKNPEQMSVLERQDSAWAEKKRAERLAEIEALGLSPPTAKPLVQRLAVPLGMPPRDGGAGAAAAVVTPRATTAGALLATAPPAAALTGTAWQEVRADDGRIYYWNRDTNSTTWDRPAELPGGGGDSARRRVRRTAPAGGTGGAPAAESRRVGGAAEPDGGRRRRRRPAGESAAAAPAAPAATSGASGRRRRTRAADAAPTAPEPRAPVAPTTVAARHQDLHAAGAPPQRRRKRREHSDRV